MQLKHVDINPSQLYADSKNIQWLDDNKEVMIGDVMYDVVFIQNSGKTVSLFLVNDNDEKALLERYNKLADSVFNDSNPAKQDVVKDFLSLKFFQNSPFQVQPAVAFFSNTQVIYNEKVKDVFLTQETPPPSILS